MHSGWKPWYPAEWRNFDLLQRTWAFSPMSSVNVLVRRINSNAHFIGDSSSFTTPLCDKQITWSLLSNGKHRWKRRRYDQSKRRHQDGDRERRDSCRRIPSGRDCHTGQVKVSNNMDSLYNFWFAFRGDRETFHGRRWSSSVKAPIQGEPAHFPRIPTLPVSRQRI